MTSTRALGSAWPLLLVTASLLGVEIEVPEFGYAAAVTDPCIVLQGGKPVDTTGGRVAVRNARESILLMKEPRVRSVQVEVDEVEAPIENARDLIRILERKFDSQDLNLTITPMQVDASRMKADVALAIRFEAMGPDDVFVRSAPDVVPLGSLLYLAKGERCLVVLALATGGTDGAGNPGPPAFPDADPATAGLFPFVKKP